jgi:hypothetical protein
VAAVSGRRSTDTHAAPDSAATAGVSLHPGKWPASRPATTPRKCRESRASAEVPERDAPGEPFKHEQ